MLPAAALGLIMSVAPPAAAARGRAEGLRQGAPTDAPSACQELRPHARRLRFDFAVTKPNHLNCGAGAGEPSNYILPTDPSSPYEMHIVSVLEGSFPTPTGDPGLPESSVHLVVYKTRKPAVLVLTARDPVLWDVTVTPEARVELVILEGRGQQVLRGVPEVVPVLQRTWGQACAYAHAWESRRNIAGPDLPLMLTSLRCATGLRESSFQGCDAGAVFEIPHYRQDKETAAPMRWEEPCPLPIDPDVPLVRLPKARRNPEQPEAARSAPSPVPPSLTPRDLPRSAPDDPAARLSGTAGTLGAPIGPDSREQPEAEARIRRENAPDRKPPDAKPGGMPTGTAGNLPPPEAPAGREDIPVRALAILLKGDRTLLTYDAVPDLLVAMERGDEALQWRAADALGQLGPGAAKAVGPLLKALKSERWRLRSSAALALGNIGAEPKRIAKKLKKLLRDKHPDVRLSAQTALDRLR